MPVLRATESTARTQGTPWGHQLLMSFFCPLIPEDLDFPNQLNSAPEWSFPIWTKSQHPPKESIKIYLQDYDFKVRLYFPVLLSVANPQTY